MDLRKPLENLLTATPRPSGAPLEKLETSVCYIMPQFTKKCRSTGERLPGARPHAAADADAVAAELRAQADGLYREVQVWPLALIIISPTLFSPAVPAPFQNMVLRVQTNMGRPVFGGFVIKANV